MSCYERRTITLTKVKKETAALNEAIKGTYNYVIAYLEDLEISPHAIKRVSDNIKTLIRLADERGAYVFMTREEQQLIKEGKNDIRIKGN